MTPQNIVSIILAGISALVSLGTVAYVSMKSSFKDRQDTEIRITNKLRNLPDEVNAEPVNKTETEPTITPVQLLKPTYETEINITFNNFEQFSSKIKSFKNNTKNDNNDNNNVANKIINNAKFIPNNNNKYFDDDRSIVDTHTDFQTAVNANNKGDEIIGDTRIKAVEKALSVFKELTTNLFNFLNHNTVSKDIESHGHTKPQFNSNALYKMAMKNNLKNKKIVKKITSETNNFEEEEIIQDHPKVFLGKINEVTEDNTDSDASDLGIDGNSLTESNETNKDDVIINIPLSNNSINNIQNDYSVEILANNHINDD